MPWLQLARERDFGSISYLFDCQECMRTRDQQARQLLGCGYEPPMPESMRMHVQPWDHVGRERHADEKDEHGRLHLPVCAGYVCSLPEVLEATHALSFKRDGELTQFCEGQSTEALRDAMTVLEVEQGRVMSWAAKNPEGK